LLRGLGLPFAHELEHFCNHLVFCQVGVGRQLLAEFHVNAFITEQYLRFEKPHSGTVVNAFGNKIVGQAFVVVMVGGA
jgi:hypothetical protein